jgi:hypothetical protein
MTDGDRQSQLIIWALAEGSRIRRQATLSHGGTARYTHASMVERTGEATAHDDAANRSAHVVDWQLPSHSGEERTA